MSNLALLPAPGSAAEFLTIYNRLAVGLREPQDSSGVTQGVYFSALKDLPFEAVRAAADGLLRERGRKWMPTTGEWRAAAELASEQLLREAVQPVRVQPWRHECESCEDTGWVLGLTCEGDSGCGRDRKHAPHSWTRPCLCRSNNHTYQRRRHFGGGEA